MSKIGANLFFYQLYLTNVSKVQLLKNMFWQNRVYNNQNCDLYQELYDQRISEQDYRSDQTF